MASKKQQAEERRLGRQQTLSDWLRQNLNWPKAVLVSVVGVAVVVTFILGQAEPATLLLAIWIAILLLLRVPPISEGARPLVQFAVALSPLLLPFAVVGIAGSVAFSLPVMIAVVPTLMAAAYYLIVMPEWEPSLKALQKTGTWLQGKRRRSRRDRRRHDIQLILVGAAIWGTIALIVYLWFQLDADVGIYEDRPEVSNAFVTLALLVFMFAAVLRLGGFAKSTIRAVTAVVGILAIVRLLMAAGLVPGHNWFVDLADDGRLGRLAADLDGHTLLAILVVLLLATVLGDAIATLTPWLRNKLGDLPARGAFDVDLAETLAGLGFAASILAALLLGGAATVGVFNYEHKAKVSVAAEADQEVEEGGKKSPAGLGIKELAEYYQPVLAFTEDELWEPVPVDSYLRSERDQTAKLIGPKGQVDAPATSQELPTRANCPGLENDCYVLTIECRQGSDACAEGKRHLSATEGGNPPHYESGAVYVRAVTKLAADGLRNSFSTAGPFGKDTDVLIQYWYFYRFDEWTRPVLSGRIVQRHEADWEAVTIGLDQNKPLESAHPLYIGYSAHCGGTWRRWDRNVEIAETTVPGQHPLIAVAEGSHANYSGTDDRRASDWARCKGFPAGTTTLLSYSANLRDVTGYAWDWRPAETFFVTQKTPPMTFPGTWGKKDTTELSNSREQVLSEGRGPKTPPLQPLWRDPTGTIFCGKTWDGPESCKG